MRTRVKICGFTRASDASAAVDAGVDALGVVLAPSSRQVTIEEAEAVLSDVPPFVTRVGVFVDPEPDFVAEAVSRLGLGVVQLSGNESPELCAAVRAACARVGSAPDTLAPAAPAPAVPIVKAIHVGDGVDPAVVKPYAGLVAAVLLDTHIEGAFGGTGRTFDWGAARTFSSGLPIVLAGGLAPENVADAIRAVRPFAVDVSSGVESARGVKDPGRISSFMAAVRVADEEVRSR